MDTSNSNRELMWSITCTDSKGNPRCITNSKGRKRRPGTKDLPAAVKTTDGQFLNFLCRCLEWDPSRRMTPEEALQHDWILEVNKPTNREISDSSISMVIFITKVL